MRTGQFKILAALVMIIAALSITACGDDGIIVGPGGPGSGGADLDIILSTPLTGNTNISGAGVTVTTTSDAIGATPVTRVQMDSSTTGQLRRVVVYFETTGGAPRAVSYFWGAADVNENIVYCPAAGCTGVTVNQGTREVFFSSTALDNNGPGMAPTKFATISTGAIQYP